MTLQLVTKSAEVRLVEALNAIDSPEGWKLVHFHLDRLLEEYKSDYQVKIALNLIGDLLRAYPGAIYVMTDRSLILLCKDMVRPVLNKLIFQLRYLYMDDPLAYLANGDENSDFCSIYNLAEDFRKCLDLATRRMAQAVRRATPVSRQAEFARVPDAPTPSVLDLSAAGLSAIEDALRVSDLSKAVRRQPVCGVLPGGGVRKVFDELYIHIVHLRHALKTDVDFFSNRWLFKYLTHILDERMLASIVSDHHALLSGPVSLNLNAQTLLSAAFSAFDAAIPASMKAAIVLEIPVVDVFADITGFMVAKQEAQRLGYRVCLDGLTGKSLPHIHREKLGVDLVKVQWNADAQSDLKTPENQDLAAAIRQCGVKRIILCRCDGKAAVEYGQALGVSLFQGRYLDGILDPNATVEN